MSRFTADDLNRLNREYGRRIRSLREGRDLTLEQLAKVAGISAGTLSAIERGKGNPTLRVIVSLVLALDLQSLEDVFGEPAVEQPTQVLLYPPS